MTGESARVVRYDIWPGVGIGGPDHEFVVQDSGEWVKYEDHESALAELAHQLEVSRGALSALNDSATEDYAALEVKLTTLLTGLEALAGEMAEAEDGTSEFEEGFTSACRIYAAQIRVVVASAGLGGGE